MPIGVDDARLEALPADCLNICAALLLDAMRCIASAAMSPDQLRAIDELEAQVKAMTVRVHEAQVVAGDALAS